MNCLNEFKDRVEVIGFRLTVCHAIVYLIDCVLDVLCYQHKKVSKNILLFLSSPDFSDNARALYEYLVKIDADRKYRPIWVINDRKKYKSLSKSGLDCVYQHAVFPHNHMHRYMYYARTAKWVFHTHGYPFSKVRNEQVLVNLWHGGMGFKGNLERGNGVPHPLKNNLTLISGDGDVCYNVAYNFFRCDIKEKYLPIGLPRNDLLFKSKVIPFIDSCSEQKILWMPTFRQTDDAAISSNSLISETGLPIIYSSAQLADLNTFLRRIKIHLYIKIHPLQKLEFICREESSNIHFLTNDELGKYDVQLYEIINHFDALISDYSSVSFDYMYLNRPIGYTLDDFKDYERLRGFAMPNPLNYMPGHHIYTYDDFVQFVSDIADNKDAYEFERKRVIKEVGMPQGDNNCQRLLDYLGIT